MGNQNREIKQLRAQVEALKAQLKVGGVQNSTTIKSNPNNLYSKPANVINISNQKKGEIFSLDTKYLISDLKKTFALTVIATLVLFFSYFSQPYWKNWNGNLSEITKNILSSIKKPSPGSVK